MVRTLVILTVAGACGAVAQGCGSSPRQSASSTAAAGSATVSTSTEAAGEPAAPPPMHAASMLVSGAAAESGGSMAAPPARVAGAAGAGSGGSGAGASGAAASPGHERLPCDVAAVFKQQCLSCHGETLNLGAPMHLVTWSDLHAPAISDPSKMVFELVALRVQDTMRPMPPKMNGKLAVADRMLLVSWGDQGAPALASDAPDCP